MTLHIPGSAALHLDEAITLDKALPVGSTVTFRARSIDLLPDTKAYIDNTSVNLLSADGDHVLHVSIRRAENRFCFNASEGRDGWGTEESVPLFGVFGQQTDAIISILVGASEFAVSVDDEPIYTFKARSTKEVKTLEYHTNGLSNSVFPEHIDVTVTTPDLPKPVPRGPSSTYQQAYFSLTAAEVAAESETTPFDYIIIGSGIGGGILAADLLDKNKRMGASSSNFSSGATTADSSYNQSLQLANGKDDRQKRILVLERGNLLFNTHSLNTPQPTSRGTYGQMNDRFYHHFKQKWDMDEATKKIFAGGPVYCLGGRSAVWGLFCPRISEDTLSTYFHESVYDDLSNKYLRKAEEWMNVLYPETKPLHRELIDRLNIHRDQLLPTTQWAWGRVASEFTNKDRKNYNFAQGAFSSIDRLLESAMDEADKEPSKRKFKTVLEAPVVRLEPKPEAGKVQPVSHVVVKDAAGNEHKIRTKQAVLAAGTIDSAAVLLRSMDGATPTEAFGPEFAQHFGHATDHYIYAVSLPFYYRNAEFKSQLGGMKLMTDITFNKIDNTTALANISLDAGSFLPRRNVPNSDLPQFIIAFILPSELAHQNNITLNDKGEPYIHMEFARDAKLKRKQAVLVDFAVDVMNSIASTLDLQFVTHEAPSAPYVPLPVVAKENIKLNVLGPGEVAHELGSIPMDGADAEHILDKDLKMRYGWNNLYVCDLSVFPYSPAANPTLSLAALSLRLSDHLLPPAETQYQPIIVYNMTGETVHVVMTNSNTKAKSLDPEGERDTMDSVVIESGKSATWKREQKESIFIFAADEFDDYDVQLVHPGTNTLITSVPPRRDGETKGKLTIRRAT